MSNDAIQRMVRVRSDKTRRRFRFGSALMAYALYRSQPLQGFPSDGDAVVRTGPDDDEPAGIDAVNSGAHT
ncbi:hypothetical protein NKI51_27345 [Mesorhizobium australicum]|uniref:hypothetical protein n=1 Tax=Mesorhizobium australicum TaxID=536018 RepID=UPI003337BF3D